MDQTRGPDGAAGAFVDAADPSGSICGLDTADGQLSCPAGDNGTGNGVAAEQENDSGRDGRPGARHGRTACSRCSRPDPFRRHWGRSPGSVAGRKAC